MNPSTIDDRCRTWYGRRPWGRYRPLQWIKDFLRFLASNTLQPCKSRLLVRSSFGKREAVRYCDERSGSPRVVNPAEIVFLLQSRLHKLSVCPVSHRTESHFSLNELLDRLIPGQRRMISINVIQHLGEK